MSPPDRPESGLPEHIAKWEAEVRAEELRLQEERDFREEMRQFAGRVDATLTHIKEGQEQHAKDDVREFRRMRKRQVALSKRLDSVSGTVNQTVIERKTNWTIITAVAGAVVAIFGLLWTMFDKFWQVTP